PGSDGPLRVVTRQQTLPAVQTTSYWRHPSMEHFLETWGYLAVFVLSFISAVGLPVGSEVAVIYGGVLASGQIPNEPHHLNLFAVILLATLAELVGSAVGYLIGS